MLDYKHISTNGWPCPLKEGKDIPFLEKKEGVEAVSPEDGFMIMRSLVLRAEIPTPS